MTSAKIVHVNKDNFEAEVLQSEKPVLLDLWAGWCVPCQMIAPTIDEIAEERDDIKVGKVDVEEELELAQLFQVENISMLVVFKNGELVNQLLGVRPKAQILAMLEEA